MSKSPTRHQSRTIAFQFLYGNLKSETNFNQNGFEQFCKSFEFEFDEFAWEIVDGVRNNLPALDAKIGSLSTNWKFDRIASVDLTVLRLSAYEILFRADIPKNVSINEAVELAKEYGEKDSPSFINGLLDKLVKA